MTDWMDGFSGNLHEDDIGRRINGLIPRGNATGYTLTGCVADDYIETVTIPKLQRDQKYYNGQGNLKLPGALFYISPSLPGNFPRVIPFPEM